METAGLRVPLGNDTCGRSDFSGSGRGPRAGLGSRRAAHPDRRGSRETPEAQESYLGCRRCPPVPGILGLGFAPPPRSAVAFARARAREAPTRAQAPPSGRAEAARGPRPGEVGASAARAEMQPACPRGRRSGSPASPARARARCPSAPDHLPYPKGAGTRTCSTSSGEHRRPARPWLLVWKPSWDFSWLHPGGSFCSAGSFQITPVWSSLFLK